MGNRNEKESRFCPFKKAVSVEYNATTGRKEMHERFEECAGERCMAYDFRGLCKMMEVPYGTR